MTYVWIEWICSRCNELHRMKFQIVTSLSAAKKIKGILQKANHYIEDSMSLQQGTKSRVRFGSRIFVKPSTDISEVLPILEAHMLQYYKVKEGSLSMDVCRE